MSVHETGRDQPAPGVDPLERAERMALGREPAVNVRLPAHRQDAPAPDGNGHPSAGEDPGISLRGASPQAARQSRDRCRAFDQQVVRAAAHRWRT